MKLSSLDTVPFKPVSHDPQLKKKVLVEGGLACIRNLSHIVLVPGNTAIEHAHRDGFEVFYCIRGEMVFMVGGKDVTIRKGSCLVVEPGELHSIVKIVEDTELLYFFAMAAK